jgi:hypothetical protein
MLQTERAHNQREQRAGEKQGRASQKGIDVVTRPG